MIVSKLVSINQSNKAQQDKIQVLAAQASLDLAQSSIDMINAP